MENRCNMLLLVLIIVSCACEKEPWAREKLSAVSSFPGLLEFYLQMHERYPPSEAEIHRMQYYPNSDYYLKSSLCRYIFNKTYFTSQTHPAAIGDYSWKKNKLIKNFYQKSKRKKCVKWGKTWAKGPKYVNPYKIGSISTGDGSTAADYIFTCIVQEPKTQNILKYFVSTNYNMNKARDDYITGRFIFVKNYNSELIVFALAEQPASTFVGFLQNIELFYVQKREGIQPAKKAENDPVCKLSNDEKLRLCTVVMNSQQYENTFTFIPIMENVDTKCEMRKVSIHIDEVLKKVPYIQRHNNLNIGPLTVFQEWMIGCTATSNSDQALHKFYVSRGYHRNRVFVYRFLEGQVILDQYCIDVSVVHE